MYIVLKTLWSLVTAAWDRMVLHTPAHLIYKLRRPGIAFLVHPRDITDIYRPYPAFRFLPEKWTRWYGAKIGAITLSSMKVPNLNGSKPARADLLSIVMDPQSVEKRDWKVLNKNLDLLYRLASRKNIRLVGLGAWLPFLTKYGARYAELRVKTNGGPAITTGHALTSWCICETLRTIMAKRHAGTPSVTVAVVGAAGSTGSLTTRMLHAIGQMHNTHLDLHLVDQEKKKKQLEVVANEFEATHSTNMMSLQTCDYVIVVTNAANAIIRSEHVQEGAVIIDDSQPRNTALELEDKAFVVDVLAHVPGLNVNFDFGFVTEDTGITFSCLAETVLVGLLEHEGDFSFGSDISLEVVNQLQNYLSQASRDGIAISHARWYSFARPMTQDRVEKLLTQQQSPVLRAAE